MSTRERLVGDTGVPADLLRTFLHSLKEELPRAVTLRERLHMIPGPSPREHATSGLVAEAFRPNGGEAMI